MPSYYTQKATGTQNKKSTDYWFYGLQPAHDHDASTAFSLGVKGVMQTKYSANQIELGHFASNQSKIPTGANVIELYYHKNNNSWTNSN
jgi:hypothetical protein